MSDGAFRSLTLRAFSADLMESESAMATPGPTFSAFLTIIGSPSAK